MSIDYRKITLGDEPFIRLMCYEAIFTPSDQKRPTIKIVDSESLSKYWKGIGKVGDTGLVALNESMPIGTCWSRFYESHSRGYGFVNEDTPELSIAIQSNFRTQGIGSALIQMLIEQLNNHNIDTLSLSVDQRNPAYQWYQKLNFKTVIVNRHSHTMIKELK